jgi:hypothetical protein
MTTTPSPKGEERVARQDRPPRGEAVASTPERVLSFGVGCFHFGIQRKAPFRFSVAEYLNEVWRVLDRLPGVTGVEVEAHPFYRDSEATIEQDIPPLIETSGFFPCQELKRIDFRVRIPLAVQEELLDEELDSDGPEEMNVYLRGNYYSPVAFVVPLSNKPILSPSQYVRLTREFLEREVSSSERDYLRFESVGPSPLHVECWLLPKNPPKEPDSPTMGRYECRLIRQVGYDVAIFSYNTERFDSAYDALEDVMREVGSQAAIVYMSNQLRNLQSRDWASIQFEMQELLENERRKGIRGIAGRLWSSSRKIKELFISLAEFESADLDISSSVEVAKDRSFKGLSNPCLRDFVDEDIGRATPYPIRQLGQLISLFDSRRIKGLELFAIVTSAVLGGTIGALLTALLSGS